MNDSTGTATFIRKCHGYDDARVYRLDPPIPVPDYEDGKLVGDHDTEYVLVSATVIERSGAETLIFEADKHGRTVQSRELSGSVRSSLDHAQALRNAGYEIA